MPVILMVMKNAPLTTVPSAQDEMWRWINVGKVPNKFTTPPSHLHFLAQRVRLALNCTFH